MLALTLVESSMSRVFRHNFTTIVILVHKSRAVLVYPKSSCQVELDHGNQVHLSRDLQIGQLTIHLEDATLLMTHYADKK